MIVLLEEIRDSGLPIDRELGLDYLASVLSEQGKETGFRPVRSARLTGRLEKISGKILLTADTTIEVTGACRRCLADVGAEVPVHFQLSLVQARTAASDEREGEDESAHKDLEGSAASFDLQAADEESFEGKQIDLGKILREQVLLALPMDLLCREDCKGLCSSCGKDLNQGECGCVREVMDPRWAALKNIKLS